MAGRLNWAMEKMGWRVPDEPESVEAEVHEYPFASTQETEVETYESVIPTASRPSADPVGSRQRIVTIHPRTFGDALAVGESFRDGTPVIMNLSGMDDAEARRIIDFAAGLVFGCHGTIERVTSRVFLLSPQHIEVARDAAGSRAGLYR